MSWSVDQAATENRNMSVAVRLHTDAGRKQAGAGVRELSTEAKSKSRLMNGLPVIKEILTGPGEVVKQAYADDESGYEDDKLPMIVDTN